MIDERRRLRPGRDLIAALACMSLAIAAVAASGTSSFATLHTILDTGALVVSAVLAVVLWDLGRRSGQPLAHLKSICFAVVAVLELLHVLAALQFPAEDIDVRRWASELRPGTWPPVAYLLPAGLWAALLVRHRHPRGGWFALGIGATAAGLLVLFHFLPRYTDPGFLWITRPWLALAPLLWLPVLIGYWKIRDTDPLARLFAMFAIPALLGAVCMLYSHAPADPAAMFAHLAKLTSELYLLFGMTQMGAVDIGRRMRAERELTLSNEALESRVRERTEDLASANDGLRAEAEIRQAAEQKVLLQLGRLELLQRLTHAIGERQDLGSIFQIVVRRVEEDMPADFTALCDFDHHSQRLTMSHIGIRSAFLAGDLALAERAQIPIDENGLRRCVSGALVYETDTAAVNFPFPRRLAAAGLRSLVMVPLMVEQRSGVFGVLVVARSAPAAFISAECEFLRQLCEHVALAANNAQLHSSLQRAYDDLQVSQSAVMQHERLRVLGQMASGIAHDINNAISPASLYLEMVLGDAQSLPPLVQKRLETVQRAVEDVAHTVARMGEFYRKREHEVDLQAIEVKRVFQHVLELTQARWRDMAQQRGVEIEPGIESEDNPVVLGVESELREALVNLVLNAADAMPQGGKLTLRTGYALEQGRTVRRRVFIEVADTGIGMDEATRRRCLEPFFTTKGDRGSGLGLAMVYGIAQRLGIDMNISSAPGEGSTFRLTFPPEVSTNQTSIRLRSAKAPKPTRILLIDDDPLLLASLREALVDEGHDVQTANGGKVGVDAFLVAQKSGVPFPVVVTDLGMPQYDGRKVAAAIKSAAPTTSIILLTGWGQRLEESGDVPEHVECVLSKPPKIAELRQAIAESQDGGGSETV